MGATMICFAPSRGQFADRLADIGFEPGIAGLAAAALISERPVRVVKLRRDKRALVLAVRRRASATAIAVGKLWAVKINGVLCRRSASDSFVKAA